VVEVVEVVSLCGFVCGVWEGFLIGMKRLVMMVYREVVLR
jgi:hypothetical protein